MKRRLTAAVAALAVAATAATAAFGARDGDPAARVTNQITCDPRDFVRTDFETSYGRTVVVLDQGVYRIGAVPAGSRVWDRAETRIAGARVGDGTGHFEVVWPNERVSLSCVAF